MIAKYMYNLRVYRREASRHDSGDNECFSGFEALERRVRGSIRGFMAIADLFGRKGFNPLYR